ncbi:MAG: hemerythrin domain-containing protein [Elusimicrobiales bacterium]
MVLYWNEFRETGLESLDRHYKDLFECLDLYSRNIAENQVEEGTRYLFKFLERFINLHFTEEEKLLRDRKYPDVDIHVTQHEYFRKKFQNIKRKSCLAPDFPIEVHRDIIDWLVLHVTKADMQWGAFIKSSGGAETTTRTEVICPKCGNPAGRGKFCGQCGFLLGVAKCPKCNEVITGTGKFCTNCGENLETKTCPSCSLSLPPNATFCSSCGTKVT